jgi:hypothetical protein
MSRKLTSKGETAQPVAASRRTRLHPKKNHPEVEYEKNQSFVSPESAKNKIALSGDITKSLKPKPKNARTASLTNAVNNNGRRCEKCGAPVAKPYYPLCRECYYAQFGELCHACTSTGKRCTDYCAPGEYFCTSHLRRGYKLFDKAVEAAMIKLPKPKV